MLPETLTALAAAGGTAAAQAAGTDAWREFRERVARWFARGDSHREQAALRQLDRTAAALDAAAPNDSDRVRSIEAASWTVRFQDLLHELDEPELSAAAGQLRTLMDEYSSGARVVSAADSGVSVGGNMTITAQEGSVAIGSIKGNVNMGGPSTPVPPKG
jgi:hypothetical protein